MRISGNIERLEGEKWFLVQWRLFDKVQAVNINIASGNNISFPQKERSKNVNLNFSQGGVILQNKITNILLNSSEKFKTNERMTMKMRK